MNLEDMSLACGRYRIVMMCCGYVESSRTSWLIFTTHCERFKTAAQAVIELALDIHAKYEDEVLSLQYVYHKECCKKAKEDVENVHCSKCGTRLKEIDFDAEHFMEYVKKLHDTDCDSYGESEGTAKREFAFWPWRAHDILGAGKDEIVFISENAERVLLDALYEVRDDLRKIEYDGNYESGEDWRSSDWKDVRKKGTNYSI